MTSNEISWRCRNFALHFAFRINDCMTELHTANSDDDSPFSNKPVATENPNLRPTGVTVTAVLCITGGIFGVMSGLMQIVQQFVGASFAGWFATAGQAGDAQREWFAELNAVTAKYLIPNVGFAGTTGLLGVCLLIGGAALLKPTGWSRVWIRRTLLAAIVIEILYQIVFVVMQIDLFPVMQRQFDVMMQPGGAGQQPNMDMVKTIQTIFFYLGFVFAAVWFLTKLSLYIWGRVYLNRDQAKAYCDQLTT